MLAATSEPTVILIFVLCVGAIAFRTVMYTRWEQRNNPRQYDRVNHTDGGSSSGPGPMISEQSSGVDSLSFADLQTPPNFGPTPPPPPDIPYDSDESWSSDPEPVIRTRLRGVPTYWKWTFGSIAFSAITLGYVMFGTQTRIGGHLVQYYELFTAILVTAVIAVSRSRGSRSDGNPWRGRGMRYFPRPR